MQHYEFTVRIPRPDQRWLRFSLRTLLLFILLCAMFLSGVIVGIRYERSANRMTSPVARSLVSEIDQLELQLREVKRYYVNPAPQIKRLEQEIANKKAQLKKLR
jgi:uncharacterized protein involved in exopolysaccharide biosynthesis